MGVGAGWREQGHFGARNPAADLPRAPKHE